MDATAEIQRAIEAANHKDHVSARAILRNVLAEEPANIDAWVAFASVAQKREHAIQCLQQAAKLDPSNEQVQRMLADLGQAPSAVPSTRTVYSPPPPSQAFLADHEDHDELDEEQRTSTAFVQSGISRADDPLPAFAMPTQGSEVNPLQTPALSSMGTPRQASSSSVKSNKTSTVSRGNIVETILLVILACVVCGTVTVVGIVYLPKLPFVANLIQAKPTPSMDEITAPIYANIYASNVEDMNAYMATIHSRSPGYEQTQSMLAPLFANYDLSYELAYVEVLEKNQREARVAFVLVTRKLRGPAFKDNQVTGVMIMRLENGQWKIYNQDIESVDYLK